METSTCCGAPIIVEFHVDYPHFSDDDYVMKVPVWVCSLCGAVLPKKDPQSGSGEQVTGG